MTLNQGKALGGSAAINNSVFTPPTKTVIDDWEALGNKGWNWDTLKSYYAKTYSSPSIPDGLDKELGVDRWLSKSGKTSGPIQLSYPGDYLHPIRRAWAESFEGKGYLMANDPWFDATVGAFSNLHSVDPVQRERSYATNAYYLPVKDRHNLKVIANAVVEGIIFDNGAKKPRATGVRFRHESHESIASASKEIILAAGAVQSPKLLEVSGIGNARILKSLGIEVVKEAEGVGENLQDHIVCDFAVEALEEMDTLDGLARQEPDVLESSMNEFMVSHTGQLTSSGIKTFAYMPVVNHFSAGGQNAVKKLLEDNRPQSRPWGSTARDLAYFDIAEKMLLNRAQPSGAYLTAIGQNPVAPDPVSGNKPKPLDGKFLTIVAILAQPLSRGNTHIESQDVSNPPAIDPKYLSNPIDVEVFGEHVLYLQDIIRSAPLSNLLKQPLKYFHSAANFSDLEGARKYIRSRATTMWHLAGTVRSI